MLDLWRVQSGRIPIFEPIKILSKYGDRCKLFFLNIFCKAASLRSRFCNLGSRFLTVAVRSHLLDVASLRLVAGPSCLTPRATSVIIGKFGELKSSALVLPSPRSEIRPGAGPEVLKDFKPSEHGPVRSSSQGKSSLACKRVAFLVPTVA